MKKALIFMLVIMILIVNLGIVLAKELGENPYDDIDKSMWSYKSITSLYQNKILEPDGNIFNPQEYETRANIMKYLYNFALKLEKDVNVSNATAFDDVEKDADYYNAVCWASANKIANGSEKNKFEPLATCSRQEVCTFMMRFADRYGFKLKLKGDESQFADSLDIDMFARSYVTACKMAGIVNGDEDGYFNPFDEITREEAAVMIDKFVNAVSSNAKNTVSPEKGEYDYLYDDYKPAPFVSLVSASSTVEDSWFDDAVFVGDSISVRLQLYSTAKNLLGDASFLCATSMSPENVLAPVTDESIHPSYNGIKVSVPDGIKLSKAKKVYIMLGVNSLRAGVDITVRQLKGFIEEVKKILPEAHIFVQSVTPMTKESNINADNLNNTVINEYNGKVRKICDENGWYFINIADAVSDEKGFLRDEYCSDNPDMGIHFNSKAAQVWVDYLKTHVPKKLKG